MLFSLVCRAGCHFCHMIEPFHICHSLTHMIIDMTFSDTAMPVSYRSTRWQHAMPFHCRPAAALPSFRRWEMFLSHTDSFTASSISFLDIFLTVCHYIIEGSFSSHSHHRAISASLYISEASFYTLIIWHLSHLLIFIDYWLSSRHFHYIFTFRAILSFILR